MPLSDLSHDGSTDGEERREASEKKRQPPFDDKPNDKAAYEYRDPLNEEGHLVTNAVMNLPHVTEEERGGGETKRNRIVSVLYRQREWGTEGQPNDYPSEYNYSISVLLYNHYYFM